ncbi:MAG: UDP-3-O-(3-hydroxymyristoyl)glucosamine N-acyltransferase [Micavibrio sp.]|nr:UDP-3-O-(3-hydroxymyristoyl)glucosamine N-acyltransferase [Micavibrio sp.]|tara:strand:- start:163 stop:1191 length:1029 start_codon:yes stop_codon:yes gene_type:complete
MADHNFHHKTSPKTLAELIELSGCKLHSDTGAECVIEDVAALQDAGNGQISFFDNVKYKDDFKHTKASACIISKEMIKHAPDGVTLLISPHPYKSYALIAQAFYPEEYPESNISKAAHIDESASIGEGCVIEAGAVIASGAKIGKGCWIGANVTIGDNVVLGDKCRIGANASISHAILGQNTRLYPGVRVGQDGFGFAIDPAGHVKVPQLGRVLIGDNVEIGANTCIDRGAGPDTVIGDGAWVDNLVQIAHNVKIGKGCVIIAQAGIAGSSIIEDYAVIAAQVGVAGHLTVGMGAQVGAQSGVMRDVPAGAKVLGAPAVPVKEEMRQIAAVKKLASKRNSNA